MNKNKLTFLVVELSDLDKLNGNEALFLAYLRQISRTKPKKLGYFELDCGYISRAIHLDRRQIARLREKLVRLGRISYVPGKNQNEKPRWKIL